MRPFTQYFPGAAHGFSDRSRQDEAVNADAFHLAGPQALALVKATVG